MNTVARSIMGIALSAGAMYMLDPVSGHRRRLLVRDQCARAARRVETGTREARRVVGMQARRFAHDHDDGQVTARIRDAFDRSELTRSAHHGRSAENGGWTLTSRLLVGTAGCALLVWGIRQRKTLGSIGTELGEIGQTLWRTAKHEIDEHLADVKRAMERGESALDAARDAARDTVDEAEDFGPSRGRSGKSDSHAHVA